MTLSADAIRSTTPSRRGLIMRLLLNLFTVLTGAYGLSLTGFLMLRAGVGESLWPVALISNLLLHLMLLPSLVLVVIVVFTPRRWLLLLLAAPVFLFLTTYGAQFMPRAGAADSNPIRLLSYNLYAGNIQVDEVLAIIRQADADVVALQELNTYLAEAIRQQLSEHYPYQALYPYDDPRGTGLLSRYPIREESWWLLAMGHQRAELDINGTPVVIYNVHPQIPHFALLRFSSSGRTNDLTDILDRAAQETLPTLLIGDFNMTDLSADYARLTARYTDAYHAVGWGLGWTFPASGQVFGWGIPLPLARLDYLFYDKHFRALDARVLPNGGGSDHLPLLVTLTGV